jgi:uncharacterized protein (DUF58 family)
MSAAGARFLDPAVLARIRDLELMARTVVQGFVNGLHRSPYLGVSVDFAEHRAYMPGDDIRQIDWRVFARSDRFYVKQFEADSNANFLLLLDVSRSMRFASGQLSKLDYGRTLAACLAYFARGQRDRVGLITFDREVVDFVPPAAKHLDVILHTLDRLPERAGKGELLAPLLRAAESARRRGILVLISDLYEDPENALRAARALQHKGSDLIVFHVLDPAELDFPYEAAANYEDLETGEKMPIVPEYVRAQYRKLMQEHVETLQRRLGENRVDYCLLDTRTPLDTALVRYLSRRERLTR